MPKKQILEDHVRHRKKLTPPLIAATDDFNKISWVETGIPETIWIALCLRKHGDESGVQIAEQFADQLLSVAPGHFVVTGSVLSSLPMGDKQDLLQELLTTGILFDLQKALLPLAQLYPSNPFNWLFSEMPSTETSQAPVDAFRRLLGDLLDKTGRTAVFTLTTLVHLACRSGMLRIRRGLSLADYPEIRNYPYTETSRIAAASVRAAANLLLGQVSEFYDDRWPNQFWNRGLKIESCSCRTKISPIPYHAGQTHESA